VRIVPVSYTTLAPRPVAVALDAAFRAAGTPVPRAALELFAALIGVESGGKVASNNVGNLSAAGFVNGVETTSYTGDAWRPPWFAEPTPESSERNKNLHAAMLAGKAPSAFRAYATIGDGIRAYAALIAKRFPYLVDAAKTGDVHQFRLALDRGYSADYTAAHEATFDSLRSRYRAAGVFEGLGTSLAAEAVAAALVVVTAIVAWGAR
jgi:hypothetical protein